MLLLPLSGVECVEFILGAKDIGPGLSDLLKMVELEEQKQSRKWSTNERSLVEQKHATDSSLFVNNHFQML